MKIDNLHPVVCFGEVLWDILPSGAVPGGAPMNVTYHLHMLNRNPALITRIGNDEKGNELREIFSRKGVCTDFFQTDPVHATGLVYAKPDENNEVTYDIVQPSAWDYIAWEDRLINLVAGATYFVFGSLAARNSVSAGTLFKLLEAAPKKVLDINLRAPHFNQPIIETLLYKADIVKMNQAELELISSWYSAHTSMEDMVKDIAERFAVTAMVITMGGNGALLWMNDTFFHHNGFEVNVMDTVGSGDAFLAGLLSQLMNNSSPADALVFANGLGAFIATQKGACPDYDLSQVNALIEKGLV